MANVPTATDVNQLEAGLLNQVPILHVKGTHFTIGYCMVSEVTIFPPDSAPLHQ